MAQSNPSTTKTLTPQVSPSQLSFVAGSLLHSVIITSTRVFVYSFLFVLCFDVRSLVPLYKRCHCVSASLARRSANQTAGSRQRLVDCWLRWWGKGSRWLHYRLEQTPSPPPLLLSLFFPSFYFSAFFSSFPLCFLSAVLHTHSLCRVFSNGAFRDVRSHHGHCSRENIPQQGEPLASAAQIM